MNDCTEPPTEECSPHCLWWTTHSPGGHFRQLEGCTPCTDSVCLKSCSCTGAELGSAATWGLSCDWSSRIPVHSCSLIQKAREMPVLGFTPLGQHHQCMQHHSLRKSVITCSTHMKNYQCCQGLKYWWTMPQESHENMKHCPYITDSDLLVWLRSQD